MKPLPPELPPNVTLLATHHDVTDQIDHKPYRAQVWGVLLDGERIGEVFLGKTKYKLESIHGKPYRLASMVNTEPNSPEYNDRNAAVLGLLEIHRGSDPSHWHVHVNDNDKPDSNDNDKPDSNDNDDKPDSNDDNSLDPAPVATHNDNPKLVSDIEDTNTDAVTTTAAYAYSASQIKKYEECPRKWGWQYLAGFPDPAGPAAAFGSRVHKILERWLREGIPPDPATKEGKVALAAMKMIPQPSPHLEIERGFRFTFTSGLDYRGFVDLGYWTEIDGVLVWVVHDHKTTGDMMWALSEKDLLDDIQAVLYAYEALIRLDVDVVVLSWGYLRTRGKAKGEPRRTTMTRAAADSGMLVINEIAETMEGHRRKHLPIAKTKPEVVLELEANAYACGNFGGCPFLDRCNLTKKEKRRSIMAKDAQKQNLRERMAARKKARGGEAPAAPAPASTPTAVPGPTPAVNPPEQPSAEEQTAPLTATEQAANEDKKGTGGKGKGAGAAAPADAAADPKPARGRGRPRGSTATKTTNGMSHEGAFVGIFSAAVAAGGETRHMEAADQAWARYKQEFMTDG